MYIGVFRFLSITALTAMLSACAGNPVSETEPVSNVATVKPGAAIDFVYKAPKGLMPADYGKLTLTFFEGYQSGTLRLEANASDGLRLVSEVNKKEFSMSGNDPHEWEVDVTASQDGVYYLNLLATVDLPDGRETGRAFSARIEVGDITSANARQSIKTNGVLSSDGTTIVMEAEEVIK
jgi:hypothetical protein